MTRAAGSRLSVFAHQITKVGTEEKRTENNNKKQTKTKTKNNNNNKKQKKERKKDKFGWEAWQPTEKRGQ